MTVTVFFFFFKANNENERTALVKGNSVAYFTRKYFLLQHKTCLKLHGFDFIVKSARLT